MTHRFAPHTTSYTPHILLHPTPRTVYIHDIHTYIHTMVWSIGIPAVCVQDIFMYVYVCMYVCMYVCTYVCMHACIYIYIYIDGNRIPGECVNCLCLFPSFPLGSLSLSFSLSLSLSLFLSLSFFLSLSLSLFLSVVVGKWRKSGGALCLLCERRPGKLGLRGGPRRAATCYSLSGVGCRM
jgi:hypothetical protein